MSDKISRYDQLLRAIDLFKPQSIVEIGTWNGRNAVRMIQQAQKYRKDVMYIGYDLFEDADAETDSAEFNIKEHNNVIEVEAFIRKNCPDSEVHLIKGNTRATLMPLEADFVYIDGGHSVETIRSDYEAVKKSKVIMFDDYYMADRDGVCPDVSVIGCNQIISELGGLVLPIGGKITGGGLVFMGMVIGQ